MDTGTQINLAFHGVDILNVNFNAVAPRTEKEMQIDINYEPKVYYPVDSKQDFKIIVNIELSAENVFSLSLTAIGNFQLSNDIDGKLKETFINANAPAIMFPYIRSFISTFTSNLGNTVGTIIIPTQFFKGNLEEYKPE